MSGIGGSSPTPASVQAMPTMTPAQQAVLGQLSGVLSGQIGTGAPNYGGQLPGTQGAQSLQNLSFANIQNLLTGNAPGQTQALTGLESLMQPWDPTQATSQWTKAVQAPAMQNWNETIAPSIMEKFAGYDAANSGGSRYALGKAGADLETGLGASLGTWLQSDKNTAAGNLLSAAGLTNSMNTDIAKLGLAGGATQYDISADQLLAPYQEFMRTQPAANPWLQYLGTDMGASSFQNITMPGTAGTATGIPGLIAGGLGAAGGIMKGLGSMGWMPFL